MDKKSSYKHLLVIRLSAMGDVAMVPHALRALRASYPELKISVLSKSLFTPLFEGLNVDIIHADTNGVHKGLFGLFRLAREIKALGVDCVADLHGVLRSNIVSRILAMQGIPTRRIIKGRVSKWMHMDGGCNEVTRPLEHTVIRYCDTIRRLGFEFADPTAAVKVARPNPMSYEKGSERWIGIAPFSAHEGKNYPLYHVETVVAKLAERYDRVFIHSGGGKELEFAERLEQEHERVTAVYSRLRLKEEIDLISMLDCIITMDSFAMHAASLTATPVVSIWGATHPMLGFSGYGCDAKGEIQLDLKCRPCSSYGNKRCRFNDYHCMHKISPETVLERVDMMVSQKR